MRFQWTDENLKWFAKAGQETDFYEKVTALLDKYLNLESIVFDIGCGMGFLSFALAKKVSKVWAVDIDSHVMEYIEKEINSKDCCNVKKHLGDWKDWKPGVCADMVIISYVDGILRDLDKLMSLTGKYIAAILPSELDSKKLGIRKSSNESNIDKRDTMESAMSFLDERGITYKKIKFQAEFGQPVASMADAEKYMEYYYGLGVDDLVKSKMIVKREKDFYIPKIRECGIVIVEKNNVLNINKYK